MEEGTTEVYLLIMKYTQHEVGKCYPRQTKEEQQALRESIKQHGLIHEIWLYEGKILSGWERYLACLDVGVTPRFRDFENTVITAPQFVAAENAERRHQSVSSLAASAAMLKQYIQSSVKELQYKKSSETHKYRTPSQKDRNNSGAKIAGKMFGVHHDAVLKAQKVMRVDPSTFQRLHAGEISISEAYAKVTPGWRDRRLQAKIKSAQKTLKRQFVGNSHAHIAKEEIRARKIMAEYDKADFKMPDNIYAPDSDYWTTDNILKEKGYALSLSRIGDTWDAVYTKSNEKLVGHTSWKGAMLQAAKVTMAKIKQEESRQITLSL